MNIVDVYPAQVETAAVTDRGLVRNHNEDNVAVVSGDDPLEREKGTILVVADGLGGYNAGEVASGMITTHLPVFYLEGSGEDPAHDLLKAVERCNTLVHTASQSSPDLRGMALTVVAALLVGHDLIFANVGDSRGYLLRKGEIIHRTSDHSLKDPMMEVPGFGVRNRLSHVLTRVIGRESRVAIDVTMHRVELGDAILLCSDGLSDHVNDEEITEAVTDFPCADASDRLVNLAKARGGDDNISVVLARVVDC